MIHSQQQLEQTIAEWGFLPFFHNGIKGFSIEEITPEELWFNDERPGPWEWKGPIIANWRAAYGKFFSGKAGYVSLEWLPDFINWRRSRTPLGSMGDEARHVYDVLLQHESLLSNELKLASGYTLSRKRHASPRDMETYAAASGGTQPRKAMPKDGPACDKVITGLEMATYVCIADFEYKLTKEGRSYGWGVARYCTPEAMYGEGIAHDQRSPEESRQKIASHLRHLFPQASEAAITRIID